MHLVSEEKVKEKAEEAIVLKARGKEEKGVPISQRMIGNGTLQTGNQNGMTMNLCFLPMPSKEEKVKERKHLERGM